MHPQIGQPAPDFTLYNTKKETVSLSQQRGKNIILLFFPFAFSRVCTAELCSVRDHMQQYASLEAEVFGISVDSLYTLARFKEEEHLDFELLSDFNKEVARSYGCLYETFSYGMKGVAKRAAFVIDKKGTVQYAEVLENAGEQPHFEAVQQTLQSLAAVI